MIWFRSADASMVWALEVARIWLAVLGCAAAGWAMGFEPTKARRSATSATTRRRQCRISIAEDPPKDQKSDLVQITDTGGDASTGITLLRTRARNPTLSRI